MTTYTSQNMGAKDLDRVGPGACTPPWALAACTVWRPSSSCGSRISCSSACSWSRKNCDYDQRPELQFWNSAFYIPLAVLIIYRYTIQGLGYSGLAMFAGVAEMVARAMVGFWFVPLWGYFAACIANPVAWFFACFFLIPAYLAVRRKLQREKDLEAAGTGHNDNGSIYERDSWGCPAFYLQIPPRLYYK